MSDEDLTRGERGPTGDTGQPGDTGETGRQGAQGIVGVGMIGERGQTGDHGQAGEPGRRGEVGLTGETGPRGLQSPGLVGALTVFFLVFSAITTYMGWRITQNTERAKVTAHRVQTVQYETCTDYNAAFTRFNLLIDRALAEERKKANPDRDRIRDLIDFRHPIRDCGAKP